MFGTTGKEWKRVTHPSQVQLGITVRDRISGLEGIAASRVEYITGCTQIAIAQEGLEAGKPKEWAYFDWQRLEMNELKPNAFSDVIESEPTRQRNGAGPLPPARY